MEFAKPLVRGTLVRRYNRFLADVTLENGADVTAHCPNPGSMMGLAEPGMTVWLEPSTNPKRKLRFSWRLVSLPGGHWAGIDTGVPNQVVGDALRRGEVAAVAGYRGVRAEVAYGKASRVDFLLTEPGQPDLYLEVKNVHLRRESGRAEFPDCVTARGAKHLAELAEMVAAGHRAVLLYCVQRTDCAGFALAEDLDPGYAAAARQAAAAGVGFFAYQTAISPAGVRLDGPLAGTGTAGAVAP